MSYIEHLKETYTRVPPEAWHAFRDQVIAISERYGNVPCQFTYRTSRR